MINREEALKLQKERMKKCVLITVTSVALIATAATLLSIYVANSPGEISFFAVFAVIIEFYILRKIHFSQFFEPKEMFVKVIKNEAVNVLMSLQGVIRAHTTYVQDHSNQIQMTLTDSKGKKFIKSYNYKSELEAIKAGDELVLMRFIYEPVVVL